ncbi:transposase [Flavobacterium sp. JP2137]|uniref:transposase n=1 Tax=Flavobacterium sp. JP2137 TaxID=3414510 RepID=UPI003D2FCD47
MFDWAKYKTNKGAVKMHTLLDFDGNLPAYINITNGKTADNKGAYDIPLLKGSVIVADRFYNDFSLLNIWDSKQVFFVIIGRFDWGEVQNEQRVHLGFHVLSRPR